MTYTRGKILADVKVFTPAVMHDDRGSFSVTWNLQELCGDIPELKPFVQCNRVRSFRGVIRGLHFQLPPQEQGKLVICERGGIFDVVVDINPTSPTYGQHEEFYLYSPRQAVWVPPGYAHGYQAVDEAEVTYYVTDYWAPHLDRAILWSDPTLAIDWPLKSPVVSDKDRQGMTLESWGDVWWNVEGRRK